MDEKWKNLKLSKALEEELRRASSKPSWESMNEGVHERVNFDDTIWGFNLAGGAYYNTPLRVTQVKDGSRAERAGIKKGDVLRSINDIDTSKLSIQEAHDIILESGLEIKLSVTAPDVEETLHYIWQDEILKLSKALEEELRRASSKPSWESMNEGVHERVNFDDTIWGFNLAGGAYYNTPLRVTQVKDGSRAERAGIKKGDVLRSINDIDTSKLSIQEAHDIILESGLEIKLSVTAPDVEETLHYIWQDEIEEDVEESRRRLELKVQNEKKVFKGAKTNEAWSVAWPCGNKRNVMYKESNCFLVPSRYEQKHPDSISPEKEFKPIHKSQDSTI